MMGRVPAKCCSVRTLLAIPVQNTLPVHHIRQISIASNIGIFVVARSFGGIENFVTENSGIVHNPDQNLTASVVSH